MGSTNKLIHDVLLDACAADMPYFSEWLGLWLIEPSAMDQLLYAVQNLNVREHLEAQQRVRGDSATGGAAYTLQDGVAVINLRGPLQKHASSMGMNTAGSTVLARRAIRDAAKNPDVGSIMLSIESPGGTAAGTMELSNDVAKARDSKPVFAHFPDMGASAAYWIGSAANQVSANAFATVGSIGTYAVVQDSHGAATNAGIKVHVVKAGDEKGIGVPGTEVTPEQLESVQKFVSSRNEFFLNGVASNRNMTRAAVDKLATGELFSADEAVSNKLIDLISTDEEAFSRARDAADKFLTPKSNRKTVMSESNVTPAQLRAACPGATSEFILTCVENSRSVEEATKLWSQELATDLAAANETVEKLKTDLEAANKTIAEQKLEISKLGEEATAPPVASVVGTRALAAAKESDDEEAGSPIDQYWSLVKARQEKGDTRQAAMAHVNKNHPDIRRNMTAAANAAAVARRR